jgi:hypothetical protein
VIAVHDGGDLLGCGNSPRWQISPDGELSVGLSRRSDLGFIGVDTDTYLAFDGWHHLVLTVSGAVTDNPVLTLYFDGNLAYRDDGFGVPIHSPWSRGHGGETGDGDLNFNVLDSLKGVEGSFDEGAAYDYALSAKQAKRHYQAADSGG